MPLPFELTQRNKAIAGGVVVVLILILLLTFASGKKDTTDAVGDEAAVSATDDATAQPETAAAAAPVAVDPKAMSDDGLYNAECMVQGGGTLLGDVEVKKSEHPSDLDKIEIKNRNTGKKTAVTMATATCSFTPVDAE